MLPTRLCREAIAIQFEQWLAPEEEAPRPQALALEQRGWLGGGDAADIVFSEDIPFTEAPPPPKPSFEEWKETIQRLPSYCEMAPGDLFYQGKNYGVIVRPQTQTFTFFHHSPGTFFPLFDEAFSGSFTPPVLPIQWETAHTSFFGPGTPPVSFRGITEEWTQEAIEEVIERGDVKILNAIILHSVDELNRFHLQNALANADPEKVLALYCSSKSSRKLDEMILRIGIPGPPLPDEADKAEALVKKFINAAIGKGDFSRSFLDHFSSAPFFDSLVAFFYDNATIWGDFELALSVATTTWLKDGLPIPTTCYLYAEEGDKQIPFVQALLQRATFRYKGDPLRNEKVNQAAVQLLKIALAQQEPKHSPRVSCYTGPTSISGIDYCFHLFFQGNATAYHLGLVLFEQGERPSKAVSNLLLSMFLSDPNKYEALKPLTGLEPAQLERLLKEASESGGDEHFLQELVSGELLLQKWMRQAQQNPDWIDFTRFEGLRALKKRAKKTGLQASPEYTSFVAAYDRLISLSPLLRFLQKVSAFLRGRALPPSPSLSSKEMLHRLLYDPSFDPTDLPSAAATYLSIFAFPYPTPLHEVEEILRTASLGEKRALYQSARGQVLIGLSHPLGPLSPSRLHGTKLVPSMVEIGALLSPKELRGRATLLSGELSGSDAPGRHNDGLVSTADVSSSFRTKPRYYKSPTGVGLAHRYAYMGLGGSQAHSHLDLGEEIAWVQWAIKVSSLSGRNLSRVSHAIRRLRSFQQGEQELTALYAALSSFPQPIQQTLKEAFQEAVVLASQEILQETPLPIIFASPSRGGTIYGPDLIPPFSEYSLTSPVRLGSDLPYAFTPEERLAEARARLSRFPQMELFPIQTLQVLELQRMIRGDRREIFVNHDPTSQQFLAFFLQEQVFPLYATPFVERPFYRDQNGKKQFLQGVDYEGFHKYEDYVSAVEAATVSPRGYHGKTHAACTAILAQLFYRIYQEKGCVPPRVTLDGAIVTAEEEIPLSSEEVDPPLYAYVTAQRRGDDRDAPLSRVKETPPSSSLMDEEDEKEPAGSGSLRPQRASASTQSPSPTGPQKISLYPALLALSTAYHDCARQHGGKDYWDAASAAQLRAHLISFGYSDEMIAPYYHALAEKDPESGVFTSLAQEIVNSADTLEILRIISLEHFKLDLLPAARLFVGKEGEIWALVRQWKEFREWLKPLLLYLDLESRNPYEDLMILLAHKGGPAIQQYLDLSDWKQREVPEMLQKFLTE